MKKNSNEKSLSFYEIFKNISISNISIEKFRKIRN